MRFFSHEQDWHKIVRSVVFLVFPLAIKSCSPTLMTQECNVSLMVQKKTSSHQPILLISCRVPALPVKNLTGSGPLHPALAGEIKIDHIEHVREAQSQNASGQSQIIQEIQQINKNTHRWYFVHSFVSVCASLCCTHASGMTGILMCAAGLPVCLTRAPKPILHPPPINKSDMKPVPGINGMRRKTKKKHLRKGERQRQWPRFAFKLTINTKIILNNKSRSATTVFGSIKLAVKKWVRLKLFCILCTA